MTPLLAARSSCRQAARMDAVAASTSFASAASRNLRTEVRSEDLTALLRTRAFSFCLLRLIWDLMFATRKPRSSLGSGSGGHDVGVRYAAPPAAHAAAEKDSRADGICPNRGRVSSRSVSAIRRLRAGSHGPGSHGPGSHGPGSHGPESH